MYHQYTKDDLIHQCFFPEEWAQILLLLSRCRVNRWLSDILLLLLLIPWILLFAIMFLQRDVLQYIVGNAVSFLFLYIASCLMTLRFTGAVHTARRSEALDHIVFALNHHFKARHVLFTNNGFHYSGELSVTLIRLDPTSLSSSLSDRSSAASASASTLSIPEIHFPTLSTFQHVNQDVSSSTSTTFPVNTSDEPTCEYYEFSDLESDP